MWDIIMWLIVGGLAGWLASMVMKTNEQMGAMANIFVGIVGALIGGWLARLIFDVEVDPNKLNLTSVLVAVVGAVILLAIFKALRR